MGSRNDQTVRAPTDSPPPTDLKQYSYNKFHDHHQKVFQRVFDKEMPYDHLRDPDFTVYQRNQVKELIFRSYFNYYPIAVGAFFGGVVLFFYLRNRRINKIKREENVSWNEALFLEGLTRKGEVDLLGQFKKFKEETGIWFENQELSFLFPNQIVKKINSEVTQIFREAVTPKGSGILLRKLRGKKYERSTSDSARR